MLTNPFPSTFLIVLSGFLLSLLGMFVADPYCRHQQATKLAKAGEERTNEAIGKLETKVNAVTRAGERFKRAEDLNETAINQISEELLQLDGVFSVEVSRKEAKKQTTMERLARGRHPGVMAQGISPFSYRLAAVDSNQEDLRDFVGTNRQYRFVRMVYQHGGTLIARPHEFYKGDELRRGIATTLGPPEEDPIGILLVTFDDLFPSDLAEFKDVSVRVNEIKLSNPVVRAKPGGYQVIRSDDQVYQSQIKIGGRLFRFTTTERTGARFYPSWIRWTVFLFSNGLACLVGLTWLQRGRAELVSRNQELLREIDRRSALQRNLQATIDFRDHERELIAHEIHDGFVQDIIGAQMFAESTLAQTDPESPVRQQTAAIADLLQNAIQEARRTIDYLKPRVVDEVGLVAALKDSVDHDQRNYNFHTKLRCDDELPRFPILVERMLYRIIREAVSNARQHSGCDQAEVSVWVDDDRIIAEVSDEGDGFDTSQIRSDSFGIPGIRQRIEMLDGKLQLKSSEFGTKLIVEIPRRLEAQEIPTNESLMLLSPIRNGDD